MSDDDGDRDKWDETEEHDNDGVYGDDALDLDPEAESEAENGSEGNLAIESHNLHETHEQKSKRRARLHEGEETRRIPDNKRTTTPFMTKYERVRLLSIRATHISQGATLLISSEGESDPLRLALREME